MNSIDKKENGFVIQLPFNVWEVCKLRDYKKGEPQKGNKVVVVGGDNYRIGLGGKLFLARYS